MFADIVDCKVDYCTVRGQRRKPNTGIVQFINQFERGCFSNF